jgi:hypothetical protein
VQLQAGLRTNSLVLELITQCTVKKGRNLNGCLLLCIFLTDHTVGDVWFMFTLCVTEVIFQCQSVKANSVTV